MFIKLIEYIILNNCIQNIQKQRKIGIKWQRLLKYKFKGLLKMHSEHT